MITGNQSFKAYEEAKRFFEPGIANDYNKTLNPGANGTVGNLAPGDIKVREEDQYLFYVDEEPSEGVGLNFVPDGGSACPVLTAVNVPLVCDMTHTISTKNIQWDKYDCVFASASPMLCPNGMVLTIARTDKIRTRTDISVMTNYKAFIVRRPNPRKKKVRTTRR